MTSHTGDRAPTALLYQPNCGISGDMHLAAMVDLGVPQTWLREQLSKLNLNDQFEIQFVAAEKMGIHGTQARVTAREQSHHRHHSTIVQLIQAAGYPASVEHRALQMFQAIAQAEAKIHNIAIEQVHFHEVGAIDSIVDIVAAALCLDFLNVQTCLSLPVEVGSGYVDCAHGRFPVPAPATEELLQQAPCTFGGVSGESTTPTGAAILASNVDRFNPPGVFTPQSIGYGIGHKDFERPNVLRVALGSYQEVPDTSTQHVKIEANIDDMTPEAYEPLFEALFEAGAVDVYLTPIIMKRGRPAHCLTALCDVTHTEQVANTLLNSSTTIGLRIINFDKRVLAREILSIPTSLGPVSVKRVTQPDGRQRWKSEHADVLRISQQQGIDYPSAKAQLDAEISQYLNNSNT